MKKLLVVSLLLSMVFASSALAIRISASDDAMVARYTASSNWGSLNYIQTYTTATTPVYSFLKFDLSGYTSFDSATLYLYDFSSPSVGTSTINAYLVPNDSWSETTITYNNQPSRSTSFASTGVSGIGWQSWNVLSLANGEAGQQLSLMLIDTSIARANKFYSDEYTDAAFRPYLEVTETAPVPEPSTVLLLGSGLLGLGWYGRKRKKA